MTPAERAALSADLARALGWIIVKQGASDGVDVCDPNDLTLPFRKFDHRSPDVCLPLIEWLINDPRNALIGKPWAENITIWYDGSQLVDAPTINEAVARAVIALKGK